ncbi:MAG: ribonuclease P protein component [Nocardioides sp.]|uniref:ribonuclease P protein component n=1 Tax=Nocardioides sp. TaxID=35761 RepID=UPI0023A16BEC|nr:ribonuclease P protein component [Nocardioides sp.]MDE0776488.1 ribonuclease P protein component [Nocardioides sp.]
MLAAANRLNDASSFRDVTRRGRRAASRTVVIHVDMDPIGGAPSVGFVVSRAVGNSVARNRVKRRLRHLARARLDLLPPGTRVVVRALPAAGSAGTAALGVDLDRSLDRALDGPLRGSRAGAAR